MAMGMSYREYWDEAPNLAVMYRKAYRIKRQTENEQAWLQGLYVYDAFAVVLANAFSKRGTKKSYYIDRPIDIFPLSEKEKKIRQAEENAKMQKALEDMVRLQKAKKKQKQSGD